MAAPRLLELCAGLDAEACSVGLALFKELCFELGRGCRQRDFYVDTRRLGIVDDEPIALLTRPRHLDFRDRRQGPSELDRHLFDALVRRALVVEDFDANGQRLWCR